MDTPTTVQLADGSTYTIPTGAWGSWPWARQANLVSVAYQQLGQAALGAEWAKQFDARAAVYNAIEAGKDRDAVLLQFGKDLLTAPLKILQDIGGAVLTVGGSVVKTATTTLALVPLVLIAGVAVLVILTAKGQLPRTVEAVTRRR
jgi:hypothetical protein